MRLCDTPVVGEAIPDVKFQRIFLANGDCFIAALFAMTINYNNVKTTKATF